MKNAWMVRAERNGRLYELFKEQGLVAIGWHEIGSLETLRSRDAIAARVRAEWPDWKNQSIAMAAGQLHRFRNEIKTGDTVLTYDPRRRVYLVGEISGDYRRDETLDPEDPNVRPVRWRDEVSRDLLSAASRNSLGAISALFQLTPEIIEDVERALRSHEPAAGNVADEVEAVEEDIFQNIQSKALEFAKDRVSGLDCRRCKIWSPDCFVPSAIKPACRRPALIAAKISSPHPTVFGFESPRIVVEVKHRKEAMGSQAIRSFLGGRHAQDKGLYVSTGGFTKEAYYEADRATIPLELMTIDELVAALIANYDRLDIETKQLLPLKRIYWPA